MFSLSEVQFNSGPDARGEICRPAKVQSSELATANHDPVTDLNKKKIENSKIYKFTNYAN